MASYTRALCILLCIVVWTYPIDGEYSDDLLFENVEQLWADFKRVYNRSYYPEQEILRRFIWESNLRYIQTHNTEYDLGLHSYTLDMNQFGDLTQEEFQAKYLRGLKHRPNWSDRDNDSFSEFLSPLNMGPLPSFVDWRKKGYVTPVKNQEQCGSCWAFSATGSLEGQYFRKNKKLVSFSEQQLVDCSEEEGNMGCNGGLMDNAFQYVKKFGIESEDDYPYTAKDGQCSYDKSKSVTKITTAVKIPPGNENKLQEAVATVGPISVAIDASHSSFQFYKNGVYNEPACSSRSLDHGVLVVGYDSYNKKVPYWLVKNSWGESWGQQGYIFMSRNKHNQCGIATMASYPQL